MIDKSQLETYKTFNDPYQIEKDYLQDLLLYNIYKSTGNGFIFKGGTALSKVYHTDRFSEDIDFTLHDYATAESNHKEKDSFEFIKRVLDSAVSGIEYRTRYLQEPSINKFGTVSAMIWVDGPRFTGRQSTLQRINFEISTKGSILIKPRPAPIVPVYAGALNYVAIVMDASEILSEKVRAVCSKGRRHKERDLYDMYVLLGKGFTPDKKVLREKFDEVNLKFSNTKFKQYILRIEDTWTQLKPFVQHSLENYNDVSNYVTDAVLKLNLSD